jgi:hypothetical protein
MYFMKNSLRKNISKFIFISNSIFQKEIKSEKSERNLVDNPFQFDIMISVRLSSSCTIGSFDDNSQVIWSVENP